MNTLQTILTDGRVLLVACNNDLGWEWSVGMVVLPKIKTYWNLEWKLNRFDKRHVRVIEIPFYKGDVVAYSMTNVCKANASSKHLFVLTDNSSVSHRSDEPLATSTTEEIYLLIAVKKVSALPTFHLNKNEAWDIRRIFVEKRIIFKFAPAKEIIFNNTWCLTDKALDEKMEYYRRKWKVICSFAPKWNIRAKRIVSSIRKVRVKPVYNNNWECFEAAMTIFHKNSRRGIFKQPSTFN